MPTNIPLAQLYNLLDEDQILQLEKIPHPGLRTEKAHAFFLIKKLLREVLPLTKVQLRNTPSGRPYLKDLPFDLSCSHKSQMVFVALISRPHQIGVDVEDLRQKMDVELFYEYFLSAEERELADGLKLNRELVIFMFWSVKESFFKCLDANFRFADIQISAVNFENHSVNIIIINQLLQNKLQTAQLKWGGSFFTIHHHFIFCQTFLLPVTGQLTDFYQDK